MFHAAREGREAGCARAGHGESFGLRSCFADGAEPSLQEREIAYGLNPLKGKPKGLLFYKSLITYSLFKAIKEAKRVMGF